MKPCGTCKEISTNYNIYPVNPEKLDSVVKKNLPKTISVYNYKKGQKFIIHGLIPNQYLFYFGAYSRAPNLKLLNKDDAYGDLKNSGIARSNEKGEAIVQLECPQVYVYDDKKIYHRHFHFVYWDSIKKTWQNDLYTHPILCVVDREFIHKWINHIKLVDALSEKSFSEHHIPSSYNLPNDQLWNELDVKKRLKIKDKNYPIVVYCWDASCNAGENVCKRLNRIGFHNIYLYKKGLKDWLSKSF